MYKWTVLIEVDAENMKQIKDNHFDGLGMFIKQEDIIGIMKIEQEAK